MNVGMLKAYKRAYFSANLIKNLVLARAEKPCVSGLCKNES